MAHPILFLRDGVGFFREDLYCEARGRSGFPHVKTGSRIKSLLPYQLHKKRIFMKVDSVFT